MGLVIGISPIQVRDMQTDPTGKRSMTTRAAARQRKRRVNVRWRAAALPASYTTTRDTTRRCVAEPGGIGRRAYATSPREPLARQRKRG